MPLFDVDLVLATGEQEPPATAADLAHALGRALHAAPGRTWVRVRTLDAAHYAEDGPADADAAPPVFVTLMLAHWPDGDALALTVRAVTDAVAACCGRPAERVHVQLAPPGAGRQAFGGTLVA